MSVNPGPGAAPEGAAPARPAQPQPTAATTCRLRLGVLVSGRGSNLQTLLEQSAAGDLPAEVVAVASNRPEAPALARAKRAGVPTAAFPLAHYPSRAARDVAMLAYLREHAVDLVVLAGYDRVLAPAALAGFPGRVVNIHPSLLPAFGNTLRAPAEALQHGVKIAGCTVHFVTDEVDGGPIILQRAVSVEDDDTPETLAARILAEEHRALPEAIRLIAANRLVLDGRRVRILRPASQ
jgi:phosphoribosylglycinamide formyltransferase-1